LSGDDPLVNRAPPSGSTSCKYQDHIVANKADTLSPGVYCGGLVIDGNAVVRLIAGIYVFRNGPFIVNSNSVVNGTGVSLVFEGSNSGFEFKSNVQVNLEAPETGEMAGLLVYQSRDAQEAEFRIESNFTRKLLGTLYMPNGHFIVNADNKVADKSAYTAIVAHTVRLNASPNLVLNTDYDATRVPVPRGLGPSSSTVILAR
jgi:hypothetical protein